MTPTVEHHPGIGMPFLIVPFFGHGGVWDVFWYGDSGGAWQPSCTGG